MAKEVFIVVHPPVMQVEWAIPTLPVACASQAGKSQPPLPRGQVSAALPDEASPISPPATGSPSQPGAGGSSAAAIEAFFAQGGAKLLHYHYHGGG
jgi:hypothetical protein